MALATDPCLRESGREGGPHEDPPELTSTDAQKYYSVRTEYTGRVMEHIEALYGTWNINPAKLWHLISLDERVFRLRTLNRTE